MTDYTTIFAELKRADEERKQAILYHDLRAWWDRLGDKRAMAICSLIWPDDPKWREPIEPAWEPKPLIANRFERRPGQCEAKTTDGRDCWRGARYNGLCYQHDYMKRKGKWDVRWGGVEQKTGQGG